MLLKYVGDKGSDWISYGTLFERPAVLSNICLYLSQPHQENIIALH